VAEKRAISGYWFQYAFCSERTLDFFVFDSDFFTVRLGLVWWDLDLEGQVLHSASKSCWILRNAGHLALFNSATAQAQAEHTPERLKPLK